MNTNLYEYIDPIAFPYEAFLFDTETSSLPIPSHWHYYVELLYILDGTVEIQMDNMSYHCSSGSVILFPPRSLHSIATMQSKAVRYYCLKFDPSVLPSAKSDPVDLRISLYGMHSSKFSCLFSPETVQNMELLPLFQDVLKEYQQKAFGFSMILTADLRKIFCKFVRYWQNQGLFLSSPSIHPAYEVNFDLISEYIDSHYFEDLSVESLSSMCGMSHSTFSSNFRQRYGMTCKEYITTTRINVAENMLLFSNHDITFIASEVGYTDCSYFIRCYKKLKNITPKQARKNHLAHTSLP